MKKFLRQLFCLAASMVMIISLCAVSASAATPKLNKTKVDLPIGYYINLKVSNPGSTVKWSVSDKDVVKLKSSGNSAKITGQKTGTAYVYAKTGGKTLSCKITVKQSFISANYNNVEIEDGNSGTITITVKGSKKIYVNNSDKSVCSASWGKWNGNKISLKITAQKPGKAELTIYTKGYKTSTAEKIHVTVVGPPTDEQQTNEQQTTEEMADKVIELVNEEREARGLNSLKKDDALTDVANLRSKEIVESFSHTRPNGEICFTAVYNMGIERFHLGENIAAWQKDAEEVMDSWMNSQGHKDNILDPNYANIGVGCYEYNGRYYWVQVFSSAN